MTLQHSRTVAEVRRAVCRYTWTFVLPWLSALATMAAIPTRDWWYASKDDALWTNRPLAEIRDRASKGDAAAQYYLGRAYFFNTSTNRSMSESYRWIRRSAEQGYSQAELLLARFCYWGLETPQSETDGFHWASRAASHGNADAMTLVGLTHLYGEGARQDAQAGLNWLRRALGAGSHIAPRWLGEYYFNGEAGTARQTNFVEALRWFEIAASNGVTSAGLRVCEMYEKGLGTAPDSVRVLYWARRLANQNSPEMMEKLSSLYAQGEGEPRDSAETPVELLRKAATLRVIDALERGPAAWGVIPSGRLTDDCKALWNRYRFGVGTARDYLAAAQWMWQAHQEDVRRVTAGERSLTYTNPPAHPFDHHLNPGWPALSEDERRWRQAVKLVRAVFDEGNADVARQIGESYLHGSPLCPQRSIAAWAWFQRAIELGDSRAAAALARLGSAFSPREQMVAREYWLPRHADWQ